MEESKAQHTSLVETGRGVVISFTIDKGAAQEANRMSSRVVRSSVSVTCLVVSVKTKGAGPEGVLLLHE
jgi:hypothetical protein